MDRYKASIDSVDNALNRLNQTLASYKLHSSGIGNGASRGLGQENSKPQKPSILPNKASTENKATEVNNVCTVTGKELPSKHCLRRLILGLRSTKHYPEQNVPSSTRISRVEEAYEYMSEEPYCLPLHIFLAIEFLGLGYPDLAAGAAYKALLLSDALENEADEYHEEASESLKIIIQQQPLEERIQVIRRAMDAELENKAPSELDPALDVELTLWLKAHYRLIMYRILTRSLLLCGCLRTALSYVKQAAKLYPEDRKLYWIRDCIRNVAMKLDRNRSSEDPLLTPNELPDCGLVRRELYPWNSHESDRLQELDDINMLMNDVSDKLEVRAVELPALVGDEGGVVTQLGVFAKEDIAPGEVVLKETSLLTANNKLQDALCDACSGDLPNLDSQEGEAIVGCSECEVVFCSDLCHDNAMDSYHPALCDKDVESIAKDVPPVEAADSLYSLLLLRALAMAETQELHPLELLDVKWIWGDFAPTPDIDIPDSIYADPNDPESCILPRMLPFSFEHNIRLPFHMLEKMDIDVFRFPEYDVWVFNTLYAKFRGTASARLSGLGGRAIRGPEVSAVHPMWCLANHSCDPNVSWEWGGSVNFWAREERVSWNGKFGKKVIMSKAGIKKDEEILNHYCDIDLLVKERREWARGALGGVCQCERCRWEEAEEKESSK